MRKTCHNPRHTIVGTSRVKAITGLSLSSIYKMARDDPDFPKPVALGPKKLTWSEEEIAAWMEMRKGSASSGGKGVVG